jgi:hypothetical protein
MISGLSFVQSVMQYAASITDVLTKQVLENAAMRNEKTGTGFAVGLC